MNSKVSVKDVIKGGISKNETAPSVVSSSSTAVNSKTANKIATISTPTRNISVAEDVIILEGTNFQGVSTWVVCQ